MLRCCVGDTRRVDVQYRVKCKDCEDAYIGDSQRVDKKNMSEVNTNDRQIKKMIYVKMYGRREETT